MKIEDARKLKIDKVVQLTGMDRKYFEHWNMGDLDKAVRVAHCSKMVHDTQDNEPSIISPPGPPSRGIGYNHSDDSALGYEFDEKSGKWKTVRIVNGETAV
jgi:hypothetical protein